jgi:hypothetical protein
VLYIKGEGVVKNFVTAAAWLRVASVNGNTDAKEDTLKLTKQMTPDQIAKAEAYTKDLIAKNPKLIKEKP